MIRALIVDDHAVVSEGLQRMFLLDGRVEVVGRAGSLAEACTLAQRLAPDVIVLDLRLPDSQGCATIAAVRQCCPHARIVALSGLSSVTAAAAREAGADAFLTKETASDVIVQTVCAWFAARSGGQATEPLTPREAHVARLAAEGLTNGEIAHALHVSENTVKTHLSRALEKLRLHSRVDLARLWRPARENPGHRTPPPPPNG